MKVRVCGALQRFASAERGSGIVEFAFVAPIFLLLVFAIVDFGRALYSYDLISNDARLGTRYAMVRGQIGCSTWTSDCTQLNGAPVMDQSKLQQHLRDLSAGIDTSQLTVSSVVYTATTGCPQTTTVPNAAAYTNKNGPGCFVTVTVSYPFQFVALSGTSFGTVPMTSTSQVAISQ